MNRNLVELTTYELERKLTGTSVLCFPVGAIEQHGPHLPLNTDLLLAEGFTEKIVERWGEVFDLWILPSFPYGLSKEHCSFSGTVSLRVESFAKILVELVGEYVRTTSSRNVIIINGHGGNRGVFEALVHELRLELNVNCCVLHPSSLSKVKSDSPLPEIHGGKSETSIMLALYPNKVRTELIRETPVEEDRKDSIKSLILDRGVTWPWTTERSDIAQQGIIGKPDDASVELGQKMLESAIESAGAVIEKLIQK